MTVSNGNGRRNGGRVPPHDLLAEAHLLASAMFDAEALDALVDVRPEDFYKPAHQHVAAALQALHAQGRPADPVTVGHELEQVGLLETVGGSSALVDLMASAPAAANAEHHARIVTDTAARRRMVAAAGQIADAAYTTGGEALAARAEQLISTAGSADTWGEPVPLDRVGDLPEFPVKVFPGWVRAHVEAVADFAQTPVDLPAVLALATLATTAGGRVVVEVRGPWREPTNLFTVVAMPPGSRKSAVFAAMTAPLLAAEGVLVTETEADIRTSSVERDIAEREAVKATQLAANTGDPEAKDEALRAAELAESVTIPTRPRLVADDITPEAAATLLAEQGGRLAVLSAEGGIFQILAGRYSGTGPSLEIFLKGHAGDMLRVDRKGRPPEFVASPALTLGLAVQPDVLRSIADIPGFRGLGLLARILYSLPPNNVGRRQVGTAPPDTHIADTYHNHLVDLTKRLHEWTDPAVLTLTPEAARTILDFEARTEPRLAPEAGDLGHMADWGGKLTGACARVAGLLHLAEWRGGIGYRIEGDTMTAATQVADYFTAHAQAVFGEMGADPALADARYILTWLTHTATTSFTRRDVLRGCRRLTKAADLDLPLRLLEDHGWIRRRPDPERIGPGRRPSPTYDLNPKARTGTQ